MIPKELEEPLADIGKKNPILRMLLAGSFLVIVTLASVVAYQQRNSKKDRNTEFANCREEIQFWKNENSNTLKEVAKLNSYINIMKDEERKRLLGRERYFDSIINLKIRK